MPTTEAIAGKIKRLQQALWAMARLRCPRCRTGRIFRGHFAMNDPCPVCGLIYEREEGYFLGAMYFSYFLSSGILIAFYVAAYLLLPGWNSMPLALVAVILYLPFMPAVFRYSRVLWIYFERAVSPSDISAGMYERQRLKDAQVLKCRQECNGSRAEKE
ncbi:MAG TPA: DUF983 domain-containing protein [Gemmataceae bacterium]|nr:DUF983 domain-containing protein [Gemmataceae bacterium]